MGEEIKKSAAERQSKDCQQKFIFDVIDMKRIYIIQ